MNNKTQKPKTALIPPHGGYRNLKSYQTAESRKAGKRGSRKAGKGKRAEELSKDYGLGGKGKKGAADGRSLFLASLLAVKNGVQVLIPYRQHSVTYRCFYRT